jgi:NTE family protein
MNSAKPKVAVVLGGGGIKPYSALPLISFLEDQKIDVDLLVGCSGGSIMVSLWASGYSTDRILTEVVPRLKKSTFKPNWKAFLALANIPYGRLDKESGFVRAEPIRKFMKELWRDTRLEDLKPRTILQVTDFQTGEGIGLGSGLLADCVYASSAIFPLLPPLKIGNRWLFDGGYTAPVPILQAARCLADIVIVVDFLEKVQHDPKGIFESLMHTGKLQARTLTANQMALSLDLHHFDIIYMKVEFEKTITFWEIDKLPQILEAGEKALEKIRNEFLLSYRQQGEHQNTKQ